MTNNQPLSGKRIVVTRSRQQSAAFCEMLVAKGAEPIPLPVIRFAALPTDPLLKLLATNTYDWLVFTSVNAVEFFFRAASPTLKSARVAAVGEATLKALAAHGVSADFSPQSFTGEALARGLPDPKGQRILLPRARGGRPEVVALLRARGAQVDDVGLYETRRCTFSAEQISNLARVDAITFTSPSSVRNFSALVTKERLPDNIVIACIGPTTADEARNSGYTVNVMPARYTVSNLIESLSNHWRMELAQ